MIPHIYNGNGTISLMIDGVMKPVDTAHKFYKEIKQALVDKDWEAIPDLVNITKKVEEAINAGTAKGKVIIQDGEVYYNQKRIHNALTERIVGMAREGFDIGHMVKFLENLMENPSYRAVNELYGFLEAGGIPITENGTFLAYKKIGKDWKDLHSGKFDNSIGAVVKMPRNEVDEDSTVTCSAGLHVCSFGYLPHYGWAEGCRVVVCEVNPASVCAVPQDYNNTKMRVCEYVVIGEVKDYKAEDTLSKTSGVYTQDVTRGKTEGTVNHLKPKDIGKALTDALNEWYNSKIFSINDMANIIIDNCIDSSLDSDYAYDIGDIIFDYQFKRAGKKVARFIKNEEMDGNNFMSNLENVIANPSEMVDETDDEEDEKECCGGCSGDNTSGCTGCCTTCTASAGFCSEKEEFKPRRCERCMNPLKGGTDLCEICGYYND